MSEKKKRNCKPTVKQVKTARMYLSGQADKTESAMTVYNIDPDKPGAQQTAIQLTNTALDRYTEYEGKTLTEVLNGHDWWDLVLQRLRENMNSEDGAVSNKAIELYAKLSDNLINKSAHLNVTGTMPNKVKKWKKGE